MMLVQTCLLSVVLVVLLIELILWRLRLMEEGKDICIIAVTMIASLALTCGAGAGGGIDNRGAVESGRWTRGRWEEGWHRT